MKVKAYAKLNLYLEILGKREDGYHFLKSFMQEVGLYDEIIIEMATADSFNANDKSLEGDDNLIYRALLAFRKKANLGPVAIYLKKNIPMGAGLGGGSSDAAASLKAFNALAGNPLSLDDLKEIGASLGADIPFFIEGGACLVEGIGEKLTPMDRREGVEVLLIKPECHLSTPKVYGELKAEDYNTSSQYDAFLESYITGGPLVLRNDLGHPAKRLCKDISEIIEKLEDQDYQAMVTGSGSCIFCLLEGKEEPKGISSYWNYKTQLR